VIAMLTIAGVAPFELAARGQHRLVTVPVSAEPALEQHLLPVVDDLDRRRALVRVRPDDHVPIYFPSPEYR
jgi:hypothetical protein